jgi:hypothetical protein
MAAVPEAKTPPVEAKVPRFNVPVIVEEAAPTTDRGPERARVVPVAFTKVKVPVAKRFAAFRLFETTRLPVRPKTPPGEVVAIPKAPPVVNRPASTKRPERKVEKTKSAVPAK